MTWRTCHQRHGKTATKNTVPAHTVGSKHKQAADGRSTIVDHCHWKRTQQTQQTYKQVANNTRKQQAHSLQTFANQFYELRNMQFFREMLKNSWKTIEHSVNTTPTCPTSWKFSQWESKFMHSLHQLGSDPSLNLPSSLACRPIVKWCLQWQSSGKWSNYVSKRVEIPCISIPCWAIPRFPRVFSQFEPHFGPIWTIYDIHSLRQDPIFVWNFQ